MEAHASHNILNVATNYKTIFFIVQHGNRLHQYVLQPIPLSDIQSIASLRLSSMHYDVRWGIGAQMMRVVSYIRFALNKFESLNNTL